MKEYIELLSLEEWIRNAKIFINGSIVWKALVLDLPLARNILIWKVGKGDKLELGMKLGLAVEISLIFPMLYYDVRKCKVFYP